MRAVNLTYNTSRLRKCSGKGCWAVNVCMDERLWGLVLWFKVSIGSRNPTTEHRPQGRKTLNSFTISSHSTARLVGPSKSFAERTKSMQCSGTCFVSKQVGDASELLRYGAGPHHRPWDLGVFLDHPAENHLSHVQVNAQTVLKKKEKRDDKLIIKQLNYPKNISDNIILDLMGTMWEKRSKKRKIWRYQRPAKCWRATMTSDTTTSAPNKILVKQFTSRSNKPTWQEKKKQTLKIIKKCRASAKQCFAKVCIILKFCYHFDTLQPQTLFYFID